MVASKAMFGVLLNQSGAAMPTCTSSGAPLKWMVAVKLCVPSVAVTRVPE